MSKPRLIVRARLDSYSGYGQLTSYLIQNFERFGYDVNVWPLSSDNYYKAILPQIAKNIVQKPQQEDWELIVSPPHVTPSKNKFTAYFTMWETTRLPKDAFENLKRAEVIIVPNQWNASCFSAQGIDVPIYVCPLGIDPKIFHYSSMQDGPCVFGTAGNSVISGRSRKGLDDVIDAFEVAFPTDQDVKLMVKTLPGKDAVAKSDDPRIHYDIRFMDDHELAQWYSGLTCFVSASRGEGWGLMNHAAMATGRPVIGTIWGGTAEFMQDGNCYALSHKLEPAAGRFKGMGAWAEPHIWDMVEHMQFVYRGRDIAGRVGVAAAHRASQFTWDRAHRRLEEILKEIGLLE